MKALDNEEKHVLAKKIEDGYLLKYKNEFYKLNEKNFEENFAKNEIVILKEIKDNPIYSIFMATTILATLIIYLGREKYVILDKNFLIANVVLFANVFLHELGHIVVLKIFYNDSKIKVGFKFIFIYPAFYVDTSDSYLLPKYKRIAVYLAGNFMNCIYVLATIFVFKELRKYSYAVVTAVLINFLPIVKSDGYYAIMTFFNRYNFLKSKYQNRIEDTVRGMVMFLFLLLISKVSAFF